MNESYSEVRIGENLSDAVHIQMYLKQPNSLSLMLFNFSLEYPIRKVQENQKGLEFIGTHELLVYADDVNVMGGSINNLKESRTLSEVSREVGLEVSTEKTKYMVAS
jgi:hypothetical protein